MFFVDFEGNVADQRTATALDELRAAALFVKILGSYPAKALRAPARPGELPDQPPAGQAVPRPASSAQDPAEMLEAVAAAPRPAAGRSRQYRLVDRAARHPAPILPVVHLPLGGARLLRLPAPRPA